MAFGRMTNIDGHGDIERWGEKRPVMYVCKCVLLNMYLMKERGC